VVEPVDVVQGRGFDVLDGASWAGRSAGAAHCQRRILRRGAVADGHRRTDRGAFVLNSTVPVAASGVIAAVTVTGGALGNRGGRERG
jgi:hypothetical protein